MILIKVIKFGYLGLIILLILLLYYNGMYVYFICNLNFNSVFMTVFAVAYLVITNERPGTTE